MSDAVDTTATENTENTKVNRREQVKALIETGNYTKAEIVAELGIKAGSVSSQMTYLRWMGMFIIADPETKKLRFVSEEEYDEYEAKAAAARGSKSSSSAKTPQERANALVGTIGRQEKQLEGFIAKVAQVTKDLESDAENAELLELLEEAKANETLMRIKLKRNRALAETLPEPEVVEETTEEAEAGGEAEAGDETESAGTEGADESGDLM